VHRGPAHVRARAARREVAVDGGEELAAGVHAGRAACHVRGEGARAPRVDGEARRRLVAVVLALWARRHEALGNYAAAAQAPEEAARAGDAARGRAWLAQAFAYRSALGDVDGARRDLDALTRWAPARTASLALDLGEVMGRLGRGRESVAWHRAWLQRRARTATTGERLRAWVQLADALHAQRQTAAGDAADRAAAALMAPRAGSTNELPEAERELLARVRFRQADRAWGVVPAAARANPPPVYSRTTVTARPDGVRFRAVRVRFEGDGRRARWSKITSHAVAGPCASRYASSWARPVASGSRCRERHTFSSTARTVGP